MAHVEREVAGADLHAAVAERLAVQALLDGLDDVCGVVWAGLHVGGPHAWKHRVPEGLAPAAGGGGDSVVPRADAVVEVGTQGAAVDEGGVLGRASLVVAVDGTTGAGQGSVVDDGDFVGGDPLVHLV